MYITPRISREGINAFSRAPKFICRYITLIVYGSTLEHNIIV